MAETAFDVVPSNGRLEFDFTGSSSHALSVDPCEYRGLSLVLAERALLVALSEVAPGVSFFKDDVILAAAVVVEANEANDLSAD